MKCSRFIYLMMKVYHKDHHTIVTSDGASGTSGSLCCRQVLPQAEKQEECTKYKKPSWNHLLLMLLFLLYCYILLPYFQIYDILLYHMHLLFSVFFLIVYDYSKKRYDVIWFKWIFNKT